MSALILGNDSYEALPSLTKAQEGAEGYAALFSSKSFEVTTVLNAPMAQMRRQLAEFYESLEPGDTAAGMRAFYAGRITFYGKDWTQEQVMADKAGFIERWPVRAYDIDEERVEMLCTDTTCEIEAKIVFCAYSGARAATSRGLAQFSYIIYLSGDPKITSETSTVPERP